MTRRRLRYCPEDDRRSWLADVLVNVGQVFAVSPVAENQSATRAAASCWLGQHPVDAAIDLDELLRNRGKPLVEVDNVVGCGALAGHHQHRWSPQLLQRGWRRRSDQRKYSGEWIPTVEVRVFQVTVNYQPPLKVSALLTGVDQVFPGQIGRNRETEPRSYSG